MGLDGVELIVNSSGSYMELRKAYVAVDLITSASSKSGGCYMFSNLRGCDGQRVYFNGCSCVALNGGIVSRGAQYELKDVVSQCVLFCGQQIIFSRIMVGKKYSTKDIDKRC